MAQTIAENTLFYGDNLSILREYIPDESVDLVYLDPPFNSNRSYNVLFRDERGKASEAQITAFDDTWHWGPAAEETYRELIGRGAANVSRMVSALYDFIGPSQMLAYLVMMAARLVELHQVLKPTGSLYLHCDPTASHYLKIILDIIFGHENFINEIVWMRTTSKALMSRRLPNNHDVIFHFSKSEIYNWHEDAIFKPYDFGNLDQKTVKKYCYKDIDGRLYRLDNLINPNPNRPNLTYEFLGVTRVWRWTKERMQTAYDAGLVVQTRPGAVPSLKRYLDEQRGKPLGDVWTDIPPINSQAAERLGYPTQKPLALLERIIQASSNPGEVVLDPFCGCGTAIAAAQKLDRRWIGIDITHLAVALQKYRLKDSFEIVAGRDYRVIGEPEDLAAARQLAQDDRYQFQWWALSLVGAKPVGDYRSGKQGKKGKDAGVDGVIYFADGPKGDPARVVVQVKSGHVRPADIRDLKGVIEREKAAIGVFITLEPPTKDMRVEAVVSGVHDSRLWQQSYPRCQILTIEELLDGAAVQMPPTHGTFQKARLIRKPGGAQGRLDL